jgi:hypothetical protein
MKMTRLATEHHSPMGVLPMVEKPVLHSPRLDLRGLVEIDETPKDLLRFG